ncbi:MAG: hypothetical protein JWQ96_3314 [Segetibacter sp.]|nr:hypothetical protein [Segetibacter sp.]
MKRITLFVTSLMFAAAINAQTPVATATVPATMLTPAADIAKVLEFKEAVHDFGKIPYGKPVEFDVEIKNISKDSVKIESVKVSCGCTTPRYEQGKSFAPGETFKVTLGFSGYAEAYFEKTVDIFFNNGLTKQVKFFGTGYKVPENAAPTNAGVQKMKGASK